MENQITLIIGGFIGLRILHILFISIQVFTYRSQKIDKIVVSIKGIVVQYKD